ncbi:replication factor C small subunit [Candidatus Alkanophaga liquidiphilum]
MPGRAEEIWIEKYRPKTLDEIVGQEEIVRNLKSYVKAGNMPHLIFSGPAGVGKTAAAVALAREFFGDAYEENFTELNASVTPETVLVLRAGGNITSLSFKELDKLIFGDDKEEEYAILQGVEVLSVADYKIKFMPVSAVARHKAERILRIKHEGGEISVTPDHSLIVITESGALASKPAAEVETGSFLISFCDGSGKLPAEPLLNFLRNANAVSWHLSNVCSAADTIEKSKMLGAIRSVNAKELHEGEQKTFETLRKLASSKLHVLKVKDVKEMSYDGWVYDVGVPRTEMFWGFAANGRVTSVMAPPVLLHNSDERGIDVVRNNIKNFARMMAVGGKFKIIFLDEADALTDAAQSALRRTMERYSATCRFIFSCNYSSKIIEPIQSRCAVYRFKALPYDAIKKRLLYIAKQERLKISEEVIKAIYDVAGGDMRRAINALQSAAAVSKEITPEIIYNITATPSPEVVEALIRKALYEDFFEALEMLNTLLDEKGVAPDELLTQMHKTLLNMEIPPEKKVYLIDRIGEVDFRIAEGANERIQLEGLLAFFHLYGGQRAGGV